MNSYKFNLFQKVVNNGRSWRIVSRYNNGLINIYCIRREKRFLWIPVSLLIGTKLTDKIGYKRKDVKESELKAFLFIEES